MLREAIGSLSQYFVTLETSKFRYFVAVDSTALWDGSLFAIALDDFYYSGVLNSKAHALWALHSGGKLGPTPRYNRTKSFEAFPFPDPTDAQRGRIRELGEQLDVHRKRRQAQHPRLTLTDMYNVLAKLRAGEPLTDADRRVHEQGLVSVLRQLHDDLDAAVLEAYGWPPNLTDDAILERLVALNAERAAEESTRGQIRWLRPDYQAPEAVAPVSQPALLEEEAVATAAAPATTPRPANPWPANPWPAGLAPRAAAVRVALAAFARPVTADEIAQTFEGRATKSRRDQVTELLETLTALGQAQQTADGRWTAM